MACKWVVLGSMGCGASSGPKGLGAVRGSRTERRSAKDTQRETIAAYVSTFLTQPIFHAQMQTALRVGANDDEKARCLQALEVLRTKLADYCDVFGGAERHAFNTKLRSSLSEAQCEAFTALRLDPVKLAHVVMQTLQANPDCFPIHLATCFTRLMERPGGIEDIKLPPDPDDDGSDAPDAIQIEQMDARLGAQLGIDAEDVAEEFPDTPVVRKGKNAPKVEISLGVAESFTDHASVAARGKQRQEAMAELKRLRERQAKARRGSLPSVGSPKWVTELENHPLRSGQGRQPLAAPAEEGQGATAGTRRRVKRSEKRAMKAAKQAAAARRPSVPAIASPKWVTVDPNARLPAAITAKGKAAKAEKKRHRQLRRHSLKQHRNKAGRGVRGYSLAGDESDEADDAERAEDGSAPLIARMPLPSQGKLQAKERPGSAPMSPGIYEPPTPSVCTAGGLQGVGDVDDGLSVEEFEQRMAEWLEYNRQEKISPGSGIRPLPLNAPGTSPHLVSPKTPVPLRASEVHSFNSRRGKPLGRNESQLRSRTISKDALR